MSRFEDSGTFSPIRIDLCCVQIQQFEDSGSFSPDRSVFFAVVICLSTVDNPYRSLFCCSPACVQMTLFIVLTYLVCRVVCPDDIVYRPLVFSFRVVCPDDIVYRPHAFSL